MPGTYELRDGICEKCGVEMELIPKEGGGLTHKCPQCGGDVGQLKQSGIVVPPGMAEAEHEPQ